MWVHEGFTNYSEGLYTECVQGKAAGAQYIIGLRKNVQNDVPIISHYGVAEEGSGDMYYKASNMLHTMRQIVNDDAKWRAMLRGLNSTFWHQTVTGAQVQAYMNTTLGMNFVKVFEQYLTTTTIPTLQYKLSGSTLSYRWANVVPGFDMPVKVTVSGDTYRLIHPTEQWQTAKVSFASPKAFKADPNFYVKLEQMF
jgi:aminopeptidase N